MDPPVATPPRLKAQPNLALDVPAQPTEPLIHPIPSLPPLATAAAAVADSSRLQRKMSTSSATGSSTLSSPAGRLASRASVRRLSGAEYNEEVASACSSGEFEELVRKLNGHARDAGEPHSDYSNSPTFHMLQSLRRARTQDLVCKITRLRLIGQGGYGRVYQGMWQGAVVAVKFLVTDNASSLERSLTEAVLSKVFMHPHVVQTFTCKMVTWEELPLGTVEGDVVPQVEGSMGSSTSASGCSTDTDEIDGAAATDEDPEEAAAIQIMGTRFVSGDGFGAPMPETGCEGYLSYEQALGQLRVQPGQFVTQIIMEFCDKGSLQSAINRGIFKAEAKWGPRTAFRALLRTAREVALGMAHIHAGNVVHGDLKPANVLLKSSRIDRRGFQAKVADFGLARVDKPALRDPSDPNSGPAPDSSPDNDFMGTVTHMAPEALGGSVTKAADVFAFGIMLWEMFTGEQPYVDLPQFAIMVGVQNGTLRPEWPASAPARLVRLSCRCWEQEAAARPPMEYVLKKLTQIELQLRHEAKRERFASSRRASMVSDASSAALDIAALQDLAAAEQALAEQQAAHSPRLTHASRTASQTGPTPLHRLSSSSELPSPLQYLRRPSGDYPGQASVAGPSGHPPPPPAIPIPHVPTMPASAGFAYSPPNPSPISCLRQHSDAFSLASTSDNPQTPPARAAAHPRYTNDLLPASSFSPTASPLGRAPSGTADSTLPPSPLPGLSSLSPFSTMGQNLMFDAADSHIPGSPFSADLPPHSPAASYPHPLPPSCPPSNPDSIPTTLQTQSPSLATFAMQPHRNPSLPSPHSKSPLPPIVPAPPLAPVSPPKPRFSLKSLLPKHGAPSAAPAHPLPKPPSFFTLLNICARHPASATPPETRSPSPTPSPAPTANPTFTFPPPMAESSKALVRSLMTTFSRPDKAPHAPPAAAPGSPTDRAFLSLVARTHLDPSAGDESDALKIASRTCSSIKDQSPFALVQRSGASELSPFAPRPAAPASEAAS